MCYMKRFKVIFSTSVGMNQNKAAWTSRMAWNFATGRCDPGGQRRRGELPHSGMGRSLRRGIRQTRVRGRSDADTGRVVRGRIALLTKTTWMSVHARHPTARALRYANRPGR